jgi:hypothetical protein
MGTCWYCHWGWPKLVMEVYKASEAKLIEIDSYDRVLKFGPSHIVWEDENFDDGSIQFCLEFLVKERDKLYKDYSDAELAICQESLEDLLKVPESVRCCIPNDYDDEHPENYPAVGVEMVR